MVILRFLTASIPHDLIFSSVEPSSGGRAEEMPKVLSYPCVLAVVSTTNAAAAILRGRSSL